jgi:hypothetical protein
MMASSLNLDRLMSVSSFEEQTNFKARRFQGSRSPGMGLAAPLPEFLGFCAVSDRKRRSPWPNPRMRNLSQAA